MRVQQFSVALPRAAFPLAVDAEISVPELPREGRTARFAEHVFDGVRQESTDDVVALSADAICVSRDLGASWRMGPGFAEARFRNCFTTRRGTHLVQELGWNGAKDDGAPRAPLARIWRFAADWSLLGQAKAGDVHWHATAAVDQAGDTIMFAEYTMNDDMQREHGRPAAVWRSRDDGAHWEKVFAVGFPGLRHFHTCAADPYRARTWLIGSGDLPEQCRAWQSTDDGDSWHEVTRMGIAPDLPPSLQPSSQALHRFTDVRFDADWIWWATDDVFANMHDVAAGRAQLPAEAGARLVRSRRGAPLAPEVLGSLKTPARNIIDVGCGFIVLSEAKFAAMGFAPAVFFVAKDDPMRPRHLFDIANTRQAATGFTYSTASRKAKDGIFFCRKAAGDFADLRPYILRWKLAFR